MIESTKIWTTKISMMLIFPSGRLRSKNFLEMFASRLKVKAEENHKIYNFSYSVQLFLKSSQQGFTEYTRRFWSDLQKLGK